ncbi:MAG: hypothetical protein F6K61_12385 [Sphaerospermopsis sp. SIO1G1]|nr:hypothetical protein [Sphaerospermopsis sp. SIO1G1]
MDIAVIVKFLAPCLPFLMNVGNKVLEGASQAVGQDIWNTGKAIWGKLQPKVETKAAALEAAEDVAKNPDDEDLQASLRVQLKKILEADTALAEEIAELFKSQSSNYSNVGANHPQSYDESIQNNTAGDFKQNDLRRIKNEKK